MCNEPVSLYFEVPPVAKQRARVARGRAYTPKKTSDFEANIKRLAMHQWNRPVLLGPVKASIYFILPRPKSRKTGVWVSVRPDLDNYIKSVLDALNGITWEDDAQVCMLHAEKQYADSMTSPRIVVMVSSLTTPSMATPS